ncbi:MAG: PEP-CTERM sorting domain-containing protein [Isosphaeraceae bacterium]
MAQITSSGDFQFHRRPVFLRAMVLILSSCLAFTFDTRREARAASITSTPNLSAEVVGHPFVLDQNGQPIVASGTGKSRSVELAPGSLPSYLAYRLQSGATVPSGTPTVNAGSGGRLQFTSLVQTQLNNDLAKYGEAVVSSGKRSFLLQPPPVVFGSSGGTTTSRGTSHAWRAGLSTHRADLASRSGSGSHATASTAASTTSPTVPTTVQAQTIIPTTVLDPVTNPKLLKDMEHLLTLKSGKLVNWDQQTFNALKSDLALSSPKNVAPKVSAPTTAKPVYEAQVLGGYGSSAISPQPAAAPEPGTLAIFGMAAIALVYRLRRG